MHDVEIRNERQSKGVFVRSCWQPAHRDPPTRFSDDGVRVFDRVLCCWVAVGVAYDRAGLAVRQKDEPPGLTAIPAHDGSGVWWVVSDRDGQPLWRIEARDFQTALVEKQRLCQWRGHSSRNAWLKLAS